MKLNETKPYLESSGELEQRSFGIKDEGMIFEILRNKMYSNPILAICREISCNARDAHRETGNVDPIHIHLPNNLEPYYKIKDFGPGISPDRMNNVFINYTASTKRSDNIQTGGFGLGAKTPFSYADCFSIITVHNGIQYNYNCLIDETKVGKLMLTSQSPSKEKNGTEIIIPVAPKNFNDFNIYTEQACRHWDVKPIIKGGNIQWQTPTFMLQGDKWGIVSSGTGNRNARMIIDGIEYPLDLTTLRNYADVKLIDASNGHFVMYFGVGELSLSASRESIYLDEATQLVIRKRLVDIRNELHKRAKEKLDAFSNLWDANVYYNSELRKSFNNIQFLGTLDWRGCPLTEHNFTTNTTIYGFTKGVNPRGRRYNVDPKKIYRTSGLHIRFQENAALYFNDLTIKDPTPRHVKKVWEDDPSITSVYVICPSEKIKMDDLFKTYNLDKMNIKLLSTITKASGRAYTPPAQRVLVFKYDARASAFRQTSYASIDEDKSNKILCSLKRDQYNGVRSAILKNGHVLDWHALKTLCSKFPNTAFYGVDEGITAERLKEDFSDFVNVESFIKDNVFSKDFDYIKIKYAQLNANRVDEYLMREANKLAPLIKDPNSLYFQQHTLHNVIKNIAKQDSGLLSIYETVFGQIDNAKITEFLKKHPDLDINEMNRNFTKKYPMLGHISSYDYSGIVPDLAKYINLIDKEIDNV